LTWRASLRSSRSAARRIGARRSGRAASSEPVFQHRRQDLEAQEERRLAILRTVQRDVGVDEETDRDVEVHAEREVAKQEDSDAAARTHVQRPRAHPGLLAVGIAAAEL